MKKLTCRLLVLAVMLLAIGAEAFADVAINETNFPDEAFRNYVLEYFNTYSGRILSQGDVDNVSQMDVSNMAISSLNGIEYFRNLSILSCQGNQLTTLDISNNTALVWLECYNNQLTAVDVSKNTALRALYCDFTITSSDNNFEFNIVDFMKAYKLDENDDYFRDVTFAYYYGEDEDDFGTVGNFLAPETIAANNVVSFTIPEGRTFRYIKMEFAYYYRSNPDDVYFIEVCVYPYHAVSSGTTGIAPIITTADLPDGTEGSSYSAALSAIGSTPITWSILSGSLPDGLSFDSSGTISGTPSAPGAYTFTVQASNSAGTGSKLFSIIVPFSEVRPPKITTTSLTNAFTDSPYGFRLQATGTSTGLTSLTWSADSLPDGLTLSTSGYLSGTPSSAGAFPFTVYVSNSQGSDSADLTLSISASPSNTQPTISTTAPDPAATGQAYTCQLMASGTPPFTWTLAKGKLPAGLSISPSGLITGSPTKKGNKSFTVIAENDFGSNKQKTLSMFTTCRVSLLHPSKTLLSPKNTLLPSRKKAVSHSLGNSKAASRKISPSTKTKAKFPESLPLTIKV